MSDINNADLLSEVEALREENERLKTRNAKLYKDCVSFAKKIKENERSDSRVAELEAEVAELKAALSREASTERLPEYVAPESQQQPEEFLFGPGTIPPEPEYEEGAIPKNHSTHKKSPFRTFIRTVLWILLIIALIVGITSGVAYLFSNNFKDYAIAGYRFATVTNNAMAPSINSDSVILIKYGTFEGIPIESKVLTTKNGRSVAKLKGIDVINGENIATVEDNHGTYSVNEKQFYGKVVFSIPYLGQVVDYACANQYYYLAIVVGSNLLLIALLVLIPSNKARAPKFGKDYTVEDFTI